MSRRVDLAPLRRRPLHLPAAGVSAVEPPSLRQVSRPSSHGLSDGTSASRAMRRGLLAAVIAAVVVLPLLYGVVLLTSPSTPSPGSVIGPSTGVTTVEAVVVLFAPFNGTTVSVVATVSTDPAVPLVETLSAQYRPTGNGSTAVFSSYYGTFAAAALNSTHQPHGVNVTLTVTYGSLTGTRNGTVASDERMVVLPVVMGRLLQSMPPVTVTAANGATTCPSILGLWVAHDVACILDTPVIVGSLTIGTGVLFEINGALNNYGPLTNYGTLANYRYGVTINDATLINYHLVENEGTFYNDGTFTNYGILTNNEYVISHGTFANYPNGTVDNNYSTFDNGGGVVYMYSGSTWHGVSPVGGTVLHILQGSEPVAGPAGRGAPSGFCRVRVHRGWFETRGLEPHEDGGPRGAANAAFGPLQLVRSR